MGQDDSSSAVLKQWAQTITAKVQTIAGQLGVEGYKRADINTATSVRLLSLSGIGAMYAKRIVAGRPYQCSDELVTKHVLPLVTYEGMKDEIHVKRS
jgi:DNA uptake protein ComE-like DNA-binding protein